jgi:hypothetical protein
MVVEKERTNSSKSFSVKSLRFPRGTLGVLRSSYSITEEIEDAWDTGKVIESVINYVNNIKIK